MPKKHGRVGRARNVGLDVDGRAPPGNPLRVQGILIVEPSRARLERDANLRAVEAGNRGPRWEDHRDGLLKSGAKDGAGSAPCGARGVSGPRIGRELPRQEEHNVAQALDSPSAGLRRSGVPEATTHPGSCPPQGSRSRSGSARLDRQQCKAVMSTALSFTESGSSPPRLEIDEVPRKPAVCRTLPHQLVGVLPTALRWTVRRRIYSPFPKSLRPPLSLWHHGFAPATGACP